MVPEVTIPANDWSVLLRSSLFFVPRYPSLLGEKGIRNQAIVEKSKSLDDDGKLSPALVSKLQRVQPVTFHKAKFGVRAMNAVLEGLGHDERLNEEEEIKAAVFKLPKFKAELESLAASGTDWFTLVRDMSIATRISETAIIGALPTDDGRPGGRVTGALAYRIHGFLRERGLNIGDLKQFARSSPSEAVVVAQSDDGECTIKLSDLELPLAEDHPWR